MRNLLVAAAALLVGLMAVAAVAPTSSEAQAAKSFKVSSRIGWQQTPLNVTKGSEYSVAYKIGDWTVDYRNFDYVGPQGYPPSIDSQIYQGCKLNSNWPYARLLGKVGKYGSLFSVGGNSFSNLGDVRTFTASTNGSLYLRIHDDDRCLGDNGGSITVNLSTGKEPGTGDVSAGECSNSLFAVPHGGNVGWLYMDDNQDVKNTDKTIHRGIDIFGNPGDVVYAPYAGEVYAEAPNFRIRHSALGVDTYFGHVTNTVPEGNVFGTASQSCLR